MHSSMAWVRQHEGIIPIVNLYNLNRSDTTVRQESCHCVPEGRKQSLRRILKNSLIRRMLKWNDIYGLAEVYARCCPKRASRCFKSICHQIRKKGFSSPVRRRKSCTHYKGLAGKFSGTKCKLASNMSQKNALAFPFIPFLWSMALSLWMTMNVQSGKPFWACDKAKRLTAAKDKTRFTVAERESRTKPAKGISCKKSRRKKNPRFR